MITQIYYVRHAESFFIEGQERSRGLSEKGIADALTVKDLLINEGIDHFISSPYQRSIATIQPAALEYSKEITIEEDLRERAIGRFEPYSFNDAKRQVYEDFDFRFPGGESSYDAQRRAIRIMEQLLLKFEGTRIVIGTHGDIMTLMMNYYNSQYDFNFWQSTSMPDIYKLSFEQGKYVSTKRLW